MALTDKQNTVELEDSPNPQLIHLPAIADNSNQIKITILDVYPGEKWDDTCINFIYVISGLQNYLGFEG